MPAGAARGHVGAAARHQAVADAHLATVEPLEPGDRSQQGGLATAARAEQGDDGAGRHRDRRGAAPRGAEALAGPLDRDGVGLPAPVGDACWPGPVTDPRHGTGRGPRRSAAARRDPIGSTNSARGAGHVGGGESSAPRALLPRASPPSRRTTGAVRPVRRSRAASPTCRIIPLVVEDEGCRGPASRPGSGRCRARRSARPPRPPARCPRPWIASRPSHPLGGHLGPGEDRTHDRVMRLAPRSADTANARPSTSAGDPTRATPGPDHTQHQHPVQHGGRDQGGDRP